MSAKSTCRSRPVRRKVNHTKEEWSRNIVLAKAGDKDSLQWILGQVEKMYRRLKNDDDVVQELLTHFYSKVLPKIDEKYLPIPIIYKSAKRILINIHKRNSRIEEKNSQNEEHAIQSLIGKMHSGTSGEQMIGMLSDAPELIKVIACCSMSPEIIRMINGNITNQMIFGMIQEYSKEKGDGIESCGTLLKFCQ